MQLIKPIQIKSVVDNKDGTATLLLHNGMRVIEPMSVIEIVQLAKATLEANALSDRYSTENKFQAVMLNEKT